MKLLICLLVLAAEAPAQTFNLLYDFPGALGTVRPESTLALSDNTLYGATTYGAVFKIKTDGTGFGYLHSFHNNYAGAPSQPLLVGDTLYGTALNQTNAEALLLFRMRIDGSNYTELANIDGSNYSYAEAGLLLLGDTLYGTTEGGGVWGNGTVFKVNTNGGGYEIIHSFAAVDASNHNTEGTFPLDGLTSDGATLYGTAMTGGTNNNYGTVFKLNPDGSGFKTLHTFTGTNDGMYPWCRLLLRGDTLYGTTGSGGYGTEGTVFKMDTNGNGFTLLVAIPTTNPPVCGNCGARGGLALIGNTIYGTCQNDVGSYPYNGNIFKVNTDGSGFAKLHVFSYPDGLPLGGLVMGSNSFYGTTAVGGPKNAGTIFSVALPCYDCPPAISSVTQTNGALAFNWTANTGSSYQIQYTTNIFATNWNNLGGTLIATNSVMPGSDLIGPDSQRFYRIVLLAP